MERLDIEQLDLEREQQKLAWRADERGQRKSSRSLWGLGLW